MDADWIKNQNLAEWFRAYSEASEDDPSMIPYRDTLTLIMKDCWVHPDRLNRLENHMRMVLDAR